MWHRLTFARRLARDSRAATTVEYGMILAMVVLAILGAMQSVGGGTGAMWNTISTKVLSAR